MAPADGVLRRAEQTVQATDRFMILPPRFSEVGNPWPSSRLTQPLRTESHDIPIHAGSGGFLVFRLVHDLLGQRWKLRLGASYFDGQLRDNSEFLGAVRTTPKNHRTEEAMRKSDVADKTFFRTSDRVFCREGAWYIRTREHERGPFETRAAARQELKHYTDTMEFIEDNEPSLPSDIDPSDVTLVDVKIPNF